uniref:Neurogenic locus notch homolog protein 1-like n=1 Tax=Crassostrea virginica TaxID=6565 RepID=A0A8B8D605_CRAVI|nr:neurogenic locus notch homolog protein 1-like [Crassostrea virginica]
MVSVPAMMMYDLLSDDYLQRSDVTRLYFNMTPWFNQSGDTMSCVWGRQHNGLTTMDKRCVTSIMFDLNNCRGKNPCFHGGICFNLYGRWTCKCPHGFKPRDCSQRVTCADFPCKNNGRCRDTGQEYVCLCDIGYKGLDCEEKFNIIASPDGKIVQKNFTHQICGLSSSVCFLDCNDWPHFILLLSLHTRQTRNRRIARRLTKIGSSGQFMAQETTPTPSEKEWRHLTIKKFNFSFKMIRK